MIDIINKIIKNLRFLMIILIVIGVSCSKKSILSNDEKEIVESEIHEFMDSLMVAFNSVSADNVYKYFLQTDEFVAATQGQLIDNIDAVRDTMKMHLAAMKKQDNIPVNDKIFVITKDAAVISTSKIGKITFKSGAEVSVPYALTILLVKRNGQWKIAHYHN